jgi:phosphoglycerate dehydrogenase-like enzyme
LAEQKIILFTTDLTAKQKESISLPPDYKIETTDEIDSSGYENIEIVLLSEHSWLTQERVQKMKRLKFIQTLWAGVDSLNFADVPDHVLVCGNVGGFSEPIAEHVFGMILSLARNLLKHDRELTEGYFDRSEKGIFLKGKNICILGTGGIGQAVARLAKAFGMTTLGINTTGKSVQYFDKTGHVSALDSFLMDSQFVVIAMPLTVHTKNLFDSRRLNLLTQNSILVNVGRGKIIDEKALYDYLLAHPTVKVGTDVWWKYPRKEEKFSQDYPFFELPNFMGSPHNSNDVPESDDIALENAFENIERYLRNETPRGIAKREDYVDLRKTG